MADQTGSLFKCGGCAAPLEGVQPGYRVQCSYCGAEQVFPQPREGSVSGTLILDGGPARIVQALAPGKGGGGVVIGGGGGLVIGGGGKVVIGGGRVVIRGGGGARGSDDLLSAGHSGSVRAHDPRAGLVVVGPHEGGLLRAVEACSRKVGWELPLGFAPGRDEMAIRGGNLYVQHDQLLTCHDLLTGQPRWQVRLTDVVEEQFPLGLKIVDPFPPGQPGGAVAVATKDERVSFVARDTGQPVAVLELGVGWRGGMLAGPGVVVLKSGERVLVVDPMRPQKPLWQMDGVDDERWQVIGNYFIMAAQDFGETFERGGCVVELPSGKPLWSGRFASELFDEDCGLPVLAGGRLWVASETAISGHPSGLAITQALKPGYKNTCIGATASTLLVLCRKDPGTPHQSLIGFDPATLQARYAVDQLGHHYDESDIEDRRQVWTFGQLALVPAKGKPADPPPHVDPEDCVLLHGLDGDTGQHLWTQVADDELEIVRNEAGYAYVETRTETLLLRPDTGEVVGRFPWD